MRISGCLRALRSATERFTLRLMQTMAITCSGRTANADVWLSSCIEISNREVHPSTDANDGDNVLRTNGQCGCLAVFVH